MLSHERKRVIESDPCAPEFISEVRRRAALANGYPDFKQVVKHIESIPAYEQWKLWATPHFADTKDAPPQIVAAIFAGTPCPFPRAQQFQLTDAEKAELTAVRAEKKREIVRAVSSKEAALELHAWAIDLLEMSDPISQLLGLATLSGRRSEDICSAGFRDAGILNGIQWVLIENQCKDRSTNKQAYKFPLLCGWARWSSALMSFRKAGLSARAINRPANIVMQLHSQNTLKEHYPTSDAADRNRPATLHSLRKLYVALLPHAYSPAGVSDEEFARRALNHRGKPSVEVYLPGSARPRHERVLADRALQ